MENSSREFLLAGEAIVTLSSRKTGRYFTYRVTSTRQEGPHFVSLLTGPSNEDNYTFFGTIFDRTTFRHGRAEKTSIRPDTDGARAFVWATRYLLCGEMPPDCDVLHMGATAVDVIERSRYRRAYGSGSARSASGRWRGVSDDEDEEDSGCLLQCDADTR